MSEARFPTEWLGHKLRVVARIGATPATSWVWENKWRSADNRLSVSLIPYVDVRREPWFAQADVSDEWSTTSYLARGATPDEAMAKCESLLVSCRGQATLTELRRKWAHRE